MRFLRLVCFCLISYSYCSAKCGTHQASPLCSQCLLRGEFRTGFANFSTGILLVAFRPLCSVFYKSISMYNLSPSRPEHPIARVSRHLGRHAALLVTIVAILWLVEIIDQLLWRGNLDGLGIRPRTWNGLGQILVAPWLHVGFGHLIANTLPLVVLGWLVMLRHMRDFVVVVLVSALVSGLGIWLFGGASTVHLGASGVIFGLFGALLARAYFERSWAALGLATVATLLYGGMIWGVLPGAEGVSWLGHLFGFIGGVLAARLIADTEIPK
jgi:membrane associated rhomboid family serine protease